MSNRLKTILLALVAVFALPLLVFLGLFFSTGGKYQVPPLASTDPLEPQVVLDGINFHAETYGKRKNPPLIVLHDGPGGDYRDLLALKALSENYRVIFYDQRGTGLSARVPDDKLTLASQLADIQTLADHYAPGQPLTLIGHGWGGMLAAAYAGSHPERVAKLILAEPGFLNEAMANQVLPVMNQSSLSFMTQASINWVRSLHIHGPDADAAQDFVFAHLRQHPAYFCGGRIPPEAPDYTLRAGFRAWRSLTGATMGPGGQIKLSFIKDLDRFQKPVLFLAGSCNRLTGKSFQTRQLRLFPRADLVEIPNSGHELFLDNPQASLKAVEDFLKK